MPSCKLAMGQALHPAWRQQSEASSRKQLLPYIGGLHCSDAGMLDRVGPWEGYSSLVTVLVVGSSIEKH